MKSTMKKLLCMALAIMLLVSAVPVFAAATDYHVDVVYKVDANGNPVSGGYVTCHPNPATGKLYSEDIETVRTAIAGLGITGWKYGGITFSSLSEIQFNNLTDSVNVMPVFPEKQFVTVKVDYGDNRLYSYNVEVGAPLGASVLPANPTRTGRKFLYWYYGSNTYNAQSVADSTYDGLTFTAAWDTVGCTECGEEVGHKTTCSQYKGSGSSEESKPSDNATTASYVSVILSTKTSGFAAGDYVNCNLVNGKITPTDRDTVANAISSKRLNIVGWKRADNGQQASSLVEFDFTGLKEPINILPIFGAGNSTNNGNNGNTVTGKITANVYANNAFKSSNTVTAASSSVNSLLVGIIGSNWNSRYAFDHYTVPTRDSYSYASPDGLINAGETVNIYLTGSGSTKYNSNKVRLHVFLNGKVNEEARTFDITYMASNDNISLATVKSYLLNYYNAKDSKGIDFDGLYLVDTNWLGKFVSNTGKMDPVNDVINRLEKGYVDINIMLNNAKAKTASTADSSNPKTGDTIFVPFMVMGVTATALAAAYVFGKKRIAR